MPAWAIALIVIFSILLVIFIFSALIFNYAGKQIVKMLNRCDSGFSAKGMQRMDISFYKNGPVAPLAEEGVKFLNSLPHEDVYITTKEGFKLHAYLYKNPYKETNKYFLGMHGFRSGPIHEYAPYAKRYFELGFNIILPDERAHYKSEGDWITMGAKERYDALDWCNFLVDKFGENIQILMQGISMGGATVCLASNLDLPKQVFGIISDCAYSSYKDEIIYTIKGFKMPTWPIVNIMENAVKKKAGITFSGETPLEAVKDAKVPMLFIHGEKDQMVPFKFVNELYEACGSKKRLYTVKDANHAESGACNMDKYFETIKEFFNIQ